MNINRVITFISSMALVIMLLLNLGLYLMFGDMSFYNREFDKYNVSESTGMNDDDIMLVTNIVADYVYGITPALENPEVNINGENKRFFTEKEMIILGESRKTISNIKTTRLLSTVVFASTALVLAFRRKFSIRSFLKCSGVSAFIITLAELFGGIAATMSFNTGFALFRSMIFNGNKMFGDKKGILLDLLSQSVFSDTLWKISFYGSIMLAVFMGTGVLIYFLDKKREFKCQS